MYNENKLKKDNEIVVRTLNMLDRLALFYCHKGSYFELVKMLQTTKSWVHLPDVIFDDIIRLLKDAKIEKMNENIYKILNPEADMSLVENDEINKVKLSDLDESQIINYFATYCRTVTYAEKDGLILMKYSPVIFETGWNKLALMCRGKIVKKSDKSIVSYPFDKFFNINERPEYSDRLIAEKIAAAKDVFITDKKDGSLIALSVYNNDFLVTTNGSFSNMQIDNAKRLLVDKYPLLTKDVVNGRTFIFEIIIPEDEHCIKYGDVEKMYLLGVRELDTMKLLDYPELVKIAQKYNLDITEQEHLSLSTMQEKVHETGANKEGWVVRIVDDNDNDFIVKIKYDEYFIIHRLRTGVNVKKVYNQYVFMNIAEMLPLMPQDIKDATLSVIEEINVNRVKIENKAIELAHRIAREANIDISNGFDTKERKKEFYFAAQPYRVGSDAPFVDFAVKYAEYKDISRGINSRPYPKYLNLVENL